MTTEETARLAYENAGREISQSFAVQNANMSLVAGTLAAILTVLGAGELFASERKDLQEVPRLSTTSLLVLTLATPLLFRFFVRSVIAYQNLIRFNAVQGAAWRYLTGREPEEAFLKHYEIYVENWRSPRSFWNFVGENLKYGYFWVLFAAFATLGWAFYNADWCWGRTISLGLLLVAATWETLTLRSTIRRYFSTPNIDETCELKAARERNANRGGPAQDNPGPPSRH